METTNKKSVQQLIDQLWKKGLTRVVISPGSRNAPLILGFTSHSKYQCYSVPDERSAGFIALGMAQQTQKPVALVCSSGSALLNYYPAIAEAFYRKIPLMVLSADRPQRLIDQGDGQTIRQNKVYANHILLSSQLEEFPIQGEEFKNLQIIKAALNLAIPSVINPGGPVHLNMPFEEPLYLKESFTETTVSTTTDQVNEPIDSTEMQTAISIWNSTSKIMILGGQKNGNPTLDVLLQKISKRALIFSETTSNIDVKGSVHCIDRLITPLSEKEMEKLQPELLLTFGGNVVSKRIKGFLRKYGPKHHIHIEVIEKAPDTYQCLTQHFNNSEELFFTTLLKNANIQGSSYVNQWINVDNVRKEQQAKFEKTVTFSDFQVMQTMNEKIPAQSIVHLANSTSIRYAQLFDWENELFFDANRGTSGIDGIVSTAMGTAMVTTKTVVLIVGDISFFYDTNAWWHRHIPRNLKVVVVNNDGGGIFRFIDGPNSTGQLESHFETHQKNSVEHIAIGFGVHYFCATSKSELESKFDSLLAGNASGILEVNTPQLENAGILQEYFKKFKNEHVNYVG